MPRSAFLKKTFTRAHPRATRSATSRQSLIKEKRVAIYKSKGSGTPVKEVAFLDGGLKAPFPRNLYTKVTYAETVTLTSTSGSVAANTFRLNSCFDPNQTGVGHQPRYFDTFCGADDTQAPYERYRVHKCAVDVMFDSNTTTVSRGGGWATVLQAASIPATYDEAREAPETEAVKLPTLGSGAGSSTRKLNMFTDMKRMLGNKDLSDNPDSGALYSANPADEVKLSVNYQDLLGNSSAVACTVYLTYYVQFYEMNHPASS